MRARIKPEEHADAMMLGIVLADQLLFSRVFQAADISLEPTVPQKMMFQDNSDKILICTSRNVAKTVSIRGRVLRDIATHTPAYSSKFSEILVVCPTEGHLRPLMSFLFSDINRVPVIKSIVKRMAGGDKPEIETKTRLMIFGRIEGSSGTDRNMSGIHPIKIYGDEMAYGDCYPSGTIIAMADGTIKKIEDVQKGDLVYGLSEDRSAIEPITVTDFLDNGERETFKLRTATRSTEATGNHPFLRLSYKGDFQWVTVKDLSTGDTICISNRNTGRFEDAVEFERIISIKSAGIKQTWDLTTSTHTFIADGIVAHNSVNHRSRSGGAQVDCKWLYAGVPNSVRSSPFYRLDQTSDGKYWSKHNFGMFTGNPSLVRNKKAQKQKMSEFGGEQSADFITQVKGLWGDEAVSTFPPGSISWITDTNVKYYHGAFGPREVREAILRDQLFLLLKTPSVQCKRALIGWDFGNVTDPTTFLVAIQTEEHAAWRTYCRYTLNQVPTPDQVEFLKAVVRQVINGKLAMLSLDNAVAAELLMEGDNRAIFENKFKLTRSFEYSEVDIETWRVITDDVKNDPVVLDKRARGKIIKYGRKHFLTESLKRFMANILNNRTSETRLELGYDPGLESDMKGTVEERRESGHVVYRVPKTRGIGRSAPDQNIDAARALADCLVIVGGLYESLPESADWMNVAGWAKRSIKAKDWVAPWGS